MICVSVILLADASYRNSLKYTETVEAIEHTQQVLLTSEEILALSQYIETSMQSFVLTNKKQFVLPFYEAKKTILLKHETLKKLIKDNPPQRIRVIQLFYLLKEKIGFSELVIKKRREAGMEVAESLIAKGFDLNTMEQIRSLVEQIQTEEKGLLKIRKDAYNKNITAFSKTFRLQLLAITIAILLSSVLIFFNLKDRKEAQDLLLESKQLLQSIIDNTTSLIYVKDLKGKFALVNKSFERLVGLGKDDIIGKTNFELFPNEIAKAFQETDDMVFAQQRTVEVEEKGEFDGKKQYYISIKSPLYHTDNKVYALCGISTNITELKKQADLIHDLYDNAPCGYYSLNLDGNFVNINKTTLDWLGYTKEELMGKSFKSILTEDSIDNFERNFPLFKLNGILKDKELTFVRKDKTKLFVIINSSAVLDENQNFQYSRSTVFDITERKKLETDLKKANLELESIEWFKLAGKATADAMWDWDLHSGRLMWGEGFETLFGYQLSNVKPDIDSWINNIHPDDKEKVVKHLYQVINSESETRWSEEFRYIKADNTYANVLDKGLLLRDKNNKPYRMVGAMQDVTVFKKNIEDLQQFSFITSHNFRAPLANLLGILDVMHYSTLDDYNKQLIEMIRTSTSQLKETIDHLSQVLVIKNKNVELQDVDINKVIKKVENDLHDDIEKIKPEISLRLNVSVVKSNKYYLESIIQNLLTNSFKYRSPDRKLHIEITTEKTLRDRTLLTFSDNGSGIEKRHMNKLFGMYQRFHNSAEGKGLGLFLIKSQITALGGSIEVQSEVDKGTTFLITL